MLVLLYILSLLPICLFVAVLLWMDSFALASWKRLIYTALLGALACAIVVMPWRRYSGWGYIFVDPFVQETMKGIIVFLMIRFRKIALFGDATIYGASVGAGFAVLENILFLTVHPAIEPMEAIMRGFEAAVMHIGTTTTLALMLIMAWQGRFGQTNVRKHIAVIIAFLLATLIHFLHNTLPIPEIVMTGGLIIYFVISKRSLFKKNNRFIHEWIDDCINNEVALLSSMKRGEFAATNAGQYLLTLKDSFNSEVFFDMCCYITEYLELSISAKSNLILRSAGIPVRPNPENKAKIAELHALKKRIGRTGERALEPIVQIRDVDKWVVDSLI